MPDLPDRLAEALKDRYALQRELGRGGMATVYLATDLKHERLVALKVLKPELAAVLGADRFLREIKTTARLTHPHILPLLDSGEVGGTLFYVMPYVEGESLRDRLNRERQLPVDDALQISREVADALSYAHDRGVIHRDIKPENILLEAGHAVVADFGIARAVDEAGGDRLTGTGIALGTPTYMSPEQAGGGTRIDGRSDIYSLGCTLYETLVGEPPFSGTPQAIIARHASETPPSMQVVRPELPPWVETVVRRALAKVPADRYPSAQVLARELSGTSGTWHAPGLLEGLRKRKVPLAAVGGVVVAVVGLARWLESRPALRRHDWVLVADFQGPADDPTLAPAVRDLTTAELDQSTYMRTLPRHQLNTAMRLAGVPETTFVDPPLARQLALRSSVRALILGNVQRIGEGSYSIALHAVRASDGADLHSVAAAASDADLVTSVQSLGRELRASLGDRRSDIEATRPLRDVATPSFEAYRRYSQALNVAGAGGDLGGANELLREAVAIDTAFASAWAAMGSNYVTARQLDSARDAFEHALAFPSRLTDANRYRLQGDVAYAIHHDVPAAVRWYDLYLEEVPHSRSGRGNRAVYLSALGRYEEAVADLREAVDANPFGPEVAQGTILNLAAALVVVGRVEEAERAAADLTGPFARYVDILVALARSDWVAVGSLAAIVDTMSRPPTFLRIHARTARASALAARGAVGAADSLLGAVAEASSGAEARWYRHAQLLLAVVSERAPWPDTAGESVPDARTPARTLRALWAAADGDSLRARNELGDPSTWTYLDSAAVGNSPDVVEALIAGKAANWHAVVTRLGAAARHGEHDPTFLDRPTSLMTRWLVADAYGRMNELDSSVSLLERIVAARDMPPGHFALRGIPYAFTLRRLALAYGRLGDRDSATRCWRTFLETTTTPDSIMQRLSDDARRTLALPGRLP